MGISVSDISAPLNQLVLCLDRPDVSTTEIDKLDKALLTERLAVEPKRGLITILLHGKLGCICVLNSRYVSFEKEKLC